MNQKADVWRGLTDVQVKDLVKNTRIKNSGSDIFRELEPPPRFRWFIMERDFFYSSTPVFQILRTTHMIELLGGVIQRFLDCYA